MEDIKKNFKNPDKTYRAVPFWSWNDKLNAQELINQIKDFKEKGIGGFFMHSRVGLETEYMGKEWLDLVEEMVKNSKEIDIDPWLYDEDRWPSGFAGGKVAEKIGDEGRAKILTLKILKDAKELSGKELAIYKGKIENENIKNIERVNNIDNLKLHEDENILALYRIVAGKSDWYNGDAPPDNLNPKSVKTFIQVTHEVYYERLKEDFGRQVKGIFTDEPNIFPFLWGGNVEYYALPWTDIFSEYFKEKRGYDFFDIAPFVFLSGEKSIKARYDYWRTISELFLESYTKNISNWCKEHHILFTGHYLEEDNFPHVILCSGSIMPHYEYMDIPGIDILTEVRYEYLTVKQATSVANQLGKSRVISETYGCTGWEFTFEGQKHVADWQYALGVNMRCQHLFLYSLRGCRKRDYPPSFNHNPSWKYQSLIEDYFARLSYIITLGKPVRDILLIHPIESSWCEFNGRDKSIPQERGEEFKEIISALLGIHYDFDLGDENIIEKYGKIDKERKEFIVGEAQYRLVIVPPVITLRKSTLSLLLEFLNNDGKVIIMEPLPEYVEGKEAKEELEKLFDHPNVIRVKGRKELTERIENIILRRISIRDVVGQEVEQFLYMERNYNGKKIFFVVNNDRERSYNVDLYLEGEGRIEEWDLLTGDIKDVFSIETEGYQHIRTTFAPSESKLYILYKGEFKKIERPKKLKRTIFLEPTFEVKRLDPNVLTIDTAQYKLDGEWSDEIPIWIIQRKIRDALGMVNIDLNGGIQRWKWVNIPHPKDNTKIELKMRFNIKDMPEKELYLLTENINETISLKLNNKEIPIKDDGWFIDKSLRKIPLKEFKIGENIIEILLNYKNSTELEDFYIIGDFAVNIDREIIKENNRITLGDWVFQGYPHYAGSLIYKQIFPFHKDPNEKYLLTIEDFFAEVIKVNINGETVGFIPWKFYKLDISDYLHNGDNLLELEVVGSLRNMLGPLHHRAKKIHFVSAHSFRPEGEEYTKAYVFHSYGLFSPVKIEMIG